MSKTSTQWSGKTTAHRDELKNQQPQRWSKGKEVGKRKRPSGQKLTLETKMAGATKISGFPSGTNLYKCKNRARKHSVALQVLELTGFRTNPNQSQTQTVSR